MTNYSKGANLERLARKILEEQHFTVVRSGGSKGPIDLVAWDINYFKLIQVKSNIRSLKKQEVTKLDNIITPNNCVKELWFKKPRSNEFIIRRLTKEEINDGI